MRIRNALMSSVISTTLSISTAPPAHAQSFFQKLFGVGESRPSRVVAAPRYTRPIPAYRFHYRPQRAAPLEPDDVDQAGEQIVLPPDSGGPYRTMCVRTCDGYYFPIRHGALQANFPADVRSCRSACGDQGRLFYYSLNGGSVDAMSDLTGKAYSALPHAYRYRKSLAKGCSCKALPWSKEEAARHQSYAEREAAEAAKAAAAKLETTAAVASPARIDASREETPQSVVDAQPAAPEPSVSNVEAFEAPPIPAKLRRQKRAASHRKTPPARVARTRYQPSPKGLFGGFLFFGGPKG